MGGKHENERLGSTETVPFIIHKCLGSVGVVEKWGGAGMGVGGGEGGGVGMGVKS